MELSFVLARARLPAIRPKGLTLARCYLVIAWTWSNWYLSPPCPLVCQHRTDNVPLVNRYLVRSGQPLQCMSWNNINGVQPNVNSTCVISKGVLVKRKLVPVLAGKLVKADAAHLTSDPLILLPNQGVAVLLQWFASDHPCRDVIVSAEMKDADRPWPR